MQRIIVLGLLFSADCGSGLEMEDVVMKHCAKCFFCMPAYLQQNSEEWEIYVYQHLIWSEWLGFQFKSNVNYFCAC